MTSHQIMISCFLYACNSVVFPNFYKRLLFLAELCSHFISRKFFSSCFDFSSFVPANLRCFKMDRKLNNSLFNTLHWFGKLFFKMYVNEIYEIQNIKIKKTNYIFSGLNILQHWWLPFETHCDDNFERRYSPAHAYLCQPTYQPLLLAEEGSQSHRTHRW